MKDLTPILKFARLNKIPVLLDDSAKFIADTTEKQNPKTILEIGTAIGYSGSIMLYSSNAILDTIEKNEQSFKIAKQNFEELQLNKRVTQYLGDGLETCKLLRENGKKYDLIFLDGPKGQYIFYLPILLDMLNDDGILICDNVLFRGLVRSTQDVGHKKRAMITKLRKFLNEIETRADLITKVYEIGDGIAVIKKK